LQNDQAITTRGNALFASGKAVHVHEHVNAHVDVDVDGSSPAVMVQNQFIVNKDARSLDNPGLKRYRYCLISLMINGMWSFAFASQKISDKTS
jgi:hypothetical protein